MDMKRESFDLLLKILPSAERMEGGDSGYLVGKPGAGPKLGIDVLYTDDMGRSYMALSHYRMCDDLLAALLRGIRSEEYLTIDMALGSGADIDGCDGLPLVVAIDKGMCADLLDRGADRSCAPSA